MPKSFLSLASVKVAHVSRAQTKTMPPTEIPFQIATSCCSNA
jgi:hypothetical protein